jgi:FkbM family methyltransferase
VADDSPTPRGHTNVTLREGIDVQVALSSSMKNADPVDLPTTQPPSVESVETPAIRRSWLKSLLYRFARFWYRLFKPLVRPIVWRMRAYLLQGIREDLAVELQMVHQLTTQTNQLTTQTNQLTTQTNQLTTQTNQQSQRLDGLDTQLATIGAESHESLVIQSQAVLPRLDRIEEYSTISARRFAIACDDGQALVRTSVGFVLCSLADHALLAALAESGELEPGTRILIASFLNPGDTFVDVGANIGLHTLAAARNVENQGQVIAFEPFAETAQMLSKTMWMNGFTDITTVYQAAVSDAPGDLLLHLGNTSGHHSLFSLGADEATSSAAVAVPVVTLDESLESGSPIDLIKIDVEGAELEVLKGAADTLAANPDVALIVEFGPSHIARSGHTVEDWFSTFDDLGMEYRVIDPMTGELTIRSQVELRDSETENLFFSYPSSTAWDRIQ